MRLRLSIKTKRKLDRPPPACLLNRADAFSSTAG